MKRLVAVMVVVLATALSAGAAAQAEPQANTGAAVATASHRCSSGTHARTPGGHRCLRSGQYCSHRRGYAKAYRRAGYRCKRNGRLARR